MKAYFVVLAHGKIGRKVNEKTKQSTHNLASAPRSTEIYVSHGHATTTNGDEIKGTVVPKMDELKGIMVPILEVNVIEG